MGTVSVHLDAVNFLAVDISGYMVAPFHYQAFFSLFLGLLGEDRAEQAGTDD